MISTLFQEKCKEWWEEDAGFFGRGYMEGDDSYEGYLSTRMTLKERTQHEVNGIVRQLKLLPDARVLDCPCGYGRHSLGLARAGFRVVGVDLNAEELQIARQQIGPMTTIQFVQGDMRLLQFSNEFDAVINMFYSFGFFESDDENRDVLRNFYNALKPGGSFLMHTDVNIARVVSGKYKFAEQRHLHSGRLLRVHDRYDPVRKRIDGSWSLVDSNGAIEELTPYSVRVYTFEEFAEWCYSTGFKRVVGYGDWDGSPLTSESEDMIVIAEK